MIYLMLFKAGIIEGIQQRSWKKVKNKLSEIKNEYLELTDALKEDMGDYFNTSFLKIIFIFHKTLKKILKIESMHTFPELVDQYEHLSSKNYELGKKVKKVEDDLLNEADKNLFYAKKAELEDLTYQKTYFTVVEKNVLINSIIFDLRSFTERLEELQYSGKELKKDDVLNCAIKCDTLLKQLTDVSRIDEQIRKGIMDIFKHEHVKEEEKEDIFHRLSKKVSSFVNTITNSSHDESNRELTHQNNLSESVMKNEPDSINKPPPEKSTTEVISNKTKPPKQILKQPLNQSPKQILKTNQNKKLKKSFSKKPVKKTKEKTKSNSLKLKSKSSNKSSGSADEELKAALKALQDI
jgi:hypothetical protein